MNGLNRRRPKTQPAAGGPPRPPKVTARGLEGDSPDFPPLQIPDPVPIKELAGVLVKKPLIIIADLMELGRFTTVRDSVEFELASKVVRKYGFEPVRAV